MKYPASILGMLAFRKNALRIQVERRASLAGVLLFCTGFLVYSTVRDSAYGALPEMARRLVPGASLIDSNLVQAMLRLMQWLLFLLIVYIPALIFWGDLFEGDPSGFSNPRQKFQSHISALFPLWGVLFIIAAPLQWLIPFIPIRLNVVVPIVIDISFGMLALSILLLAYTFWTVQQLRSLSSAHSFAVIVLSLYAFLILVLFKLC